MQKPPFKFKQFSVAQDKCGMKVNTDGVLLGAWVDITNANTVLDIGSGTGVIALMMAQKNLLAIIDAIDIDADAYIQAKENFENSTWSKRLHAIHTSLQNFEPGKKYDLIISNPPYFINDFKTKDHQKNIAKHSISLPYSELIFGISRLLSDTGKAYVVLPIFNLELFESLLLEANLFVTTLCEVTAVQGKTPYLVLIQIERVKRSFDKTLIVIQKQDGSFTDQYKELTKEFYLKF